MHTLQRINDNREDVRVGVFFEAAVWSGEPASLEPERHGELAWFDADSLPFDKIMPFQAEALKAIAQGKKYSKQGW